MSFFNHGARRTLVFPLTEAPVVTASTLLYEKGLNDVNVIYQILIRGREDEAISFSKISLVNSIILGHLILEHVSYCILLPANCYGFLSTQSNYYAIFLVWKSFKSSHDVTIFSSGIW